MEDAFVTGRPLRMDFTMICFLKMSKSDMLSIVVFFFFVE